MAVRFVTAGDMLSRTTNVPARTAVTALCWVKLVVDTNTYQGVLHVSDGTFNYLFAGTNVDGTTFGIYNNTSVVGGSAMTVGTWYHIGFTCAGDGAGQLLGYLNGVLNVTHAGNSAVTVDRIVIGKSIDGNQSNAAVAAVKYYGAVLTAAEIAQEMGQYLPVRTANLNTFLPLCGPASEFGVDFSGNAGTMTVAGTLASEDGPPIPWRQGRRRLIRPIAAAAPAFVARGSIALRQAVKRAAYY